MLLALAACAAEAAPTPGVTPPAGWMPLPQLASAAQAQIAGSKAQAWGEPAMGCYAATLTFAQKGAVAAMLDDAKKAVTVHDVVEPKTRAGVLAFAFDRAPYKGRVRAVLDGTTVAALACFWNEREPAACEAACTALIGSQP
jgi:hypothetical protein